MQVTDDIKHKARLAGIAAYGEIDCDAIEASVIFTIVDAALTAALSEKQAAEVAIKPLAWRDGDGAYAFSEITQKNYSIAFEEGKYWAAWDARLRPFDTLDAAKAAAQSDYETRIRSALVDVPAVESEPVAWMREMRMQNPSLPHRVELGRDADLVKMWRHSEHTVSLTPLYAHAPRSLPNEEIEIDADLLARCKEIVEWKRTGKLPGDHLRRRGQSIADRLGGSLFIDNGLNQAELQTIDEALGFIIALSTRKGSAGDGSATGTKGGAE